MRSYGSIINKYLKQKKSYISVLVSLILGISLLTSISIISNSNYINNVNEIKGMYGDYDIRIQSVDQEVLDKVNSSSKIDEYAIGQSDGVINVQYGDGAYGIVDIYALEEKGYENYFKFKLIDGRMPEKEDEVMINSSVVKTLQKNYKIGDTITVDVEVNRTRDDYEWYRNNAIYEKIQIGTPDNLVTGDKMDDEIGKLKVEKRSYKVVGIIDCGENNELWNNRIMRVLSEEELKHPRDFELFTKINISTSKESLDKLAEELGLNFRNALSIAPLGVPTSDIKFSGYQGAIGVLRSQSLIMVGIVFIFVCISVVNSYNITIAMKTKLYGIMRAMGGSKKQIAFLIFKETMFMMLISIPLGILLGIGVFYLQLNTVGSMFNVSSIYEISYDITTVLLILLLVIALVTFLVLKGVLKQSRITPIDAIRDAAGHSISSKGYRRFGTVKLEVDEIEELAESVAYEKTTLKAKILSAIYGFEGSLANKNILRNRLRNRNSVMTLLIAMMMMVIFFVSLINSLIRVQYLVKSEMWNATLINEIGIFNEEDIKEIEQVDNVESVYLDYVSYIPSIVNSNKFGVGLEKRSNYDGTTINFGEDYLLTTKLRGADEKALEGYKDKLIKGEINQEALNNNGVILVAKGVNSVQIDGGKMYYESNPVLKLNVGDEIEIPLDSDIYSKEGVENYIKGSRKNIKVKVIGIVSEDVFENSLERNNNETMESDFRIITTEETFKRITGINETNKALINISTEGNRNEKSKAISEYCYKDGKYIIFNDSYNNLLNERQSIAEDIFYQVAVASTILVMVFVNLVVTCTANILERKREFAALTAIGMEKKQRVKVIFAEGTYIALKCTFIAIAFALIAVSGTLNNRTDFMFSMGEAYLIILSLILIIAVISIILCIIPARRLDKESIIDVLKEDN